LRCGDADVSFSAEDVGWHVSIEGPMPADVATRLVAVVAAQVEREVGEPIQVIDLG
jgi:hypothetical protein